MKKHFFYLNLLSICTILIFFSLLNSCTEGKKDEPQKYSFWQGAIVNKYYFLDLCGGRTGQESGKPYMVLEYDPISNKPIRCEFGLSEAVYTGLPRKNPITCLGSIPQPTLSASNFTYADRLDLKGSVDLLSNWRSVTLNSDLSDGGFDFTVNVGKYKLHFEKTNQGMTGEIVDEGQSGWGDAVSNANAFNLLYIFSSTTIAN